MQQQSPTIIRQTVSIILTIACVFNICCSNALSLPESGTHFFYDYVVEHRKLPSTTILKGSYRSFTLFIPKSDPGLPKSPFPVAVLIPGFLCSGAQMRNNAEYLVQRGFIVITPNLSRILLFDKHRMHNVQTILDEITWLTEQGKIPGGEFKGMVDPNRLALLGHSFGGSACIEVLLKAQKAKIPIHTFVSNDTVPWCRSMNHMPLIAPVDILSLRAQPAVCNEFGIVSRYLHRLKFPYEDIVVKGSGHCDGENPSKSWCLCLCGSLSQKKHRDLFLLLTYLYFRDSLKAPALWSPTASFTQISQLLEDKGKITTKWYMPDNKLLQCSKNIQP